MAQKDPKKPGKAVFPEKQCLDNDPFFVKKRLAAIAFLDKAGYPPAELLSGQKGKAGMHKK
ncbi:MAG: hypothetical protein QM664_00145 [Flavihumibacter sp.]